MTESTVVKKIRLLAGSFGSRLFRNNVGKGWSGQFIRYTDRATVSVGPGDVVIRGARRINYGLFVGSSDLIGWTKVKITSDMVGKTLAVFTAIEAKSKTGRLSEDQKNFINVVRNSGGLAGVARSDEDAKGIFDDFRGVDSISKAD